MSNVPDLTPVQRAAIIEIVREAARTCILPRFQRLADADVSTKSGPSDLVTLADTEAEAQMTAALRTLLPGAVVVGEEAIAADPTLRSQIGGADLAVIIDPVDGTWNFAKGLPLFGVILAVTRKGRPVFGVLYEPIMDDWIIATADDPATLIMADGTTRTLHTSAQTKPGAMVGYVPLGLMPRRHREAMVAEFPDFGRITSLRCACHEYRMVTLGHAEFALSGPTPHAWDHAAGVLCVQRAGGVARMLDGSEYDAGVTKGYVLSAASQVVWDKLAGKFGFLLS
jgi:fructose-1,6-bisphosphatase/inositol monophosphatase family enzyme